MGLKPAKIAGIVSLVAGLLFIISGSITWGMISSQLASEKITVAADSPTLAGDDVNGPFSAYAQAEIIKVHALRTTGGLTFAELGDAQNKVKAEAKAKGIDLNEKDPAKVAELEKMDGYTEAKASLDKLTAQRNTIMNASFLRSSLFTSVISFGLAALVVGLGVLLLVFGWAWLALAGRARKAESTDSTAPATE